MKYIDNINYRKSLDLKILQGEKLSFKEKKWCAENPIFNEKYMEPYYQKDIIKLTPQCSYKIIITVEKFTNSNNMIPIIGTVLGKGEIIANYIICDQKSNKVKTLGVVLTPQTPTTTFILKTENGFVNLQYQCEYFDDKMNLYKIESSIANLSYAMKKIVISDCKSKYICKNPFDDMDDLIFILEWQVLDQ